MHTTRFTMGMFGLVLLAATLLLSCLFPASADPYLGGIPLETIREGEVSGGLFVEGSYPMATDASVTFLLPEYTAVQWARLYVVVYSGHMQNNYQVQAETEFDGGRGFSVLATEILNVPYTYPGEGGSGPVRLNAHTNRVTSDYLMWYDVKDRVQEGNVRVRVKTTRPPGYTGTFDGRIKAIVLVVAYDDGDQDRVIYWVNHGHDEDGEQTEEILGETYVGETSFSTSVLDDEWEHAELVLVHLASENAEYEFNRDSLDSGSPQGAYAGLDRHDVTDSIWKGRDSDLTYDNAGRFFKMMLATLAVRYPGSDTGSIRVTSSPAGATISLDWEEQDAVTNTTLVDVPAGYHIVTVEKEGYRDPPQQSVTVETGTESGVQFLLDQEKGTISVESIPDGAEVRIDGALHPARTPCMIPDVSAGSREITIRLSGYEDWVETVDLSDGESLTIGAELLIRQEGSATSGGSAGESSSGMSADSSGYRGSAMSLYRKGSLNGTLLFTTASDYTGLIQSGQQHAFTLPDTIPAGSEIALCRLYLYTTWSHDRLVRAGTPAKPVLSLNGREVKVDATYTDRKREGIYDYPVQTFAYDLGGIITPGVKAEVKVRNGGGSGQEFAAYGLMLLSVLKNETSPEITYWICEGSDVVFADPRFGTSAKDARTRAEFTGSVERDGVGEAKLYMVSTAASGEGGDQHQVIFNDGEWYNPLTQGSSGVSTATLDVLPWLSRSGNVLELVSLPVSGKGDYMENRNAVLVLTRGGPAVVAPVETGSPEQLPITTGTSPPVVTAGHVFQPGDQEAVPPIPARTLLPLPPPDGSSFPGNIIEWVFSHLFGIFGVGGGHGEGLSAGIATGTSVESFGGEADGEISPVPSRAPCDRDPVPDEGVYKIHTDTSSLTGDHSSVVSALPVPEEGSGGAAGVSHPNSITGGVFIDSYPRGADILIDGRQVPSKTPFLANWLKGGMHTVKVKKEVVPFTPESRQVWVTPGIVSTVKFSGGATMMRRLAINSTAWTGAQFTVNGMGPVLRIPTEVTLEGISPFVTVRSDQEWISHTVLARIDDGSEVVLEPAWQSAAGIEVISTPPGAMILIDGFDTGKRTPAFVEGVSPGQHLVEALLPGHLPSSKLVTLVDFPGETCDMVIMLPLEQYLSGTLSVESDPPGAKVYLFGKDTGRKTPTAFEYLSIGTIQGKVRWDDAEREFEVDILPGQTITVSLDPARRR